MKTSVEIQEDNRAKISVEVEAQEVDTCLAKTYKEFANRYTFPGFRKGKAPRAIIDNAFGPLAVSGTVTEELVEKYAPIAIDESGISPVGDPDFGEAEIMVKKGEDFVFSFFMNQRQVFDLTSYDAVEIEMPESEVSEAEVQKQSEMMIEYYAEYTQAADGAQVEDGNRVVFDLKAYNDKNEELANLCSDTFRYGVGGGLLPESFDEKVLGAKVGDELEFSIPMPEKTTMYTAALKGKTETISFKALVKGIEIKTLPELTDAWVEENLGYETVAEFTERMKGMLVDQKAQALPRIKENRVLEAIRERLDGEVPTELAEEQEASLLQDFFGQLQSQGVSFDSYLSQQGITSDEFKDDVKKQARDMAAEELALTAWAKHEGITATEEDVRAEFVRAGVEDADALYENWRENGRLHLIRDGVVRQKALEDLVEKAIVTEVPYEA